MSTRPRRSPSTKATPDDGCSAAAAMRNNDVLPAPLAPMITQRSSSSTDQVTGPTSTWPSRRSETSVKSISRSGSTASLPVSATRPSCRTATLRRLSGRALLRWDLDPAHHAVERVGGLDLAARDAEQKQHGVQVWVAQRRVGDFAQ